MSPINHVGWASPADVRDAVDAARHAGAAWAKTAARRRAAVLRSIADDVRAHAKDLAPVIMHETGKRAAEALAEASFSAEYFDWFADAATAPADRYLQNPDKRYIVTSRPAGVVAAATPWNFPLSIPARKVAAALAAGCPVVLRHRSWRRCPLWRCSR